MQADLVLDLKSDSGVAFDEAWSPAGDLLVVAGLDSALYAWDVRSGSHVHTVPHSELLTGVDWGPDGMTTCGGQLRCSLKWPRARGLKQGARPEQVSDGCRQVRGTSLSTFFSPTGVTPHRRV